VADQTDPAISRANAVSEAIRNGTGTPVQIGIFCDTDDCEHEVLADYLCPPDAEQPERFEIARAHLRTLGWTCDEHGDHCPQHANGAPR
jgi:hypothetical protein